MYPTSTSCHIHFSICMGPITSLPISVYTQIRQPSAVCRKSLSTISSTDGKSCNSTVGKLCSLLTFAVKYYPLEESKGLSLGFYHTGLSLFIVYWVKWKIPFTQPSNFVLTVNELYVVITHQSTRFVAVSSVYSINVVALYLGRTPDEVLFKMAQLFLWGLKVHCC